MTDNFKTAPKVHRLDLVCVESCLLRKLIRPILVSSIFIAPKVADIKSCSE